MAGAVAFLFQVSAFFWLAPAMAANLMPICTPGGIEYHVVPDEAGQPVPKESPDMAGHGCPLCPVMSGLSVPPPDPFITMPAGMSRHGSVSLPGEHIAAGWFLSTLQARAPPAAG